MVRLKNDTSAVIFHTDYQAAHKAIRDDYRKEVQEQAELAKSQITCLVLERWCAKD